MVAVPVQGDGEGVPDACQILRGQRGTRETHRLPKTIRHQVSPAA